MSILVCGNISSNPGPVSMPGRNGLSVLYFNACSLANKMAFLESQLVLNGYHIVAVTESHLDDTILDMELFPPNYIIYRKDRNRKGGGLQEVKSYLLVVTVMPIQNSCGSIFSKGKTNYIHLEFFTGCQIIQLSLWSI